MAADMEALYQQRLARYTTALRNEMPDRVPIRPFVAEFTAKYAGFTCQDVTHDYNKAFAAARKCAADFDWDAVVGNMVYVWTGLTQAIGLKYYGVPGIDIPAITGFQYHEPAEADAFMKADEYDALIDDPTGFLYNVWLPRVSCDIRAPGEPCSYRNNLALVKGGMAMFAYFSAFGGQDELLRSESGTVSAIAGILKAPFDILADKLRGYLGLVNDMYEQPDKVLAACEALAPHLYNVAATSADPAKSVPIGFWLHRGCVPFIKPAWFETHYWPTLKPIIEELWAQGNQTLFYAEGDWTHHLERFAELPEGSIVYHVDRADVAETHRKLGGRFCLSGGIPNVLLSYGTPGDVRTECKKVLDSVAKDGGYIMDAGAIMQDDTSAENLRAMTDFTREYGVYSSGHSSVTPPRETGGSSAAVWRQTRVKPGGCVSWEEKKRELPEIVGDPDLVQRVWEEIDGLGNMFVWQCLLSF